MTFNYHGVWQTKPGGNGDPCRRSPVKLEMSFKRCLTSSGTHELPH